MTINLKTFTNAAGALIGGAGAYAGLVGLPTTGGGWGRLVAIAIATAIANQIGLHQTPPGAPPASQ